MNRKAKLSWVVATLVVAGVSSTQAAFFSLPAALRYQLERIQFETAALPPLAYTRFCLQYPQECKIGRAAFHHHHVEVLNAARLQELAEVNRNVNRTIAPRSDLTDVINERWRVSPNAGPCHDYAVTKRHELLARGWPAQSLLLAEVVVPWGEHHLVLVVRTNDGDLVLDNLSAGIKLWTRTPYHWVRIQSPGNPNLWATVGRVSA